MVLEAVVSCQGCPPAPPRPGPWVAAVILAVADDHLSRHLAHAIASHLKWCRSRGVAVPDELRMLLSTLVDVSGQQRPNLPDPRVLGDGRLVDYETAALMLSVSPRTVRRMVADGRLRAVPVGRRRLLLAEELRRLADVA